MEYLKIVALSYTLCRLYTARLSEVRTDDYLSPNVNVIV